MCADDRSGLAQWKKWFVTIVAGALTGMTLGAQPEPVRQTVYTSTPYQQPVATAPWFRRLVQGADGNFYGTAPPSATGDNGSVICMSRAGSLTNIVRFNGNNGSRPAGGLVPTANGNFYGTTEAGGMYGLGTIYRFSLPGTLQSIHSFRGSDAARPAYELVPARDGLLYGVTRAGGTNPAYIFRSDVAGAVTVLTNLSSSLGDPTDGLVEGPDGWLYGTLGVDSVQASSGRIFKVGTNGEFQVLAVFSQERPIGGLACGTDGFLYGTLGHTAGTVGYPPPPDGSVFRMTIDGVRTTLFSFGYTNSSGANPMTRLLLTRDGSFYGMTAEGINPRGGRIFRITTDGVLTPLAHGVGFDTTIYATPGLVQADDGNIYGTAIESHILTYTSSIIWRLAPPPLITGTAVSNGCMTLYWTSFRYGTYQVQRKDSLDQANWTTVSSVINATGEQTTFTDSPLHTPGRFYRVSLLP